MAVALAQHAGEHWRFTLASHGKHEFLSLVDYPCFGESAATLFAQDYTHYVTSDEKELEPRLARYLHLE
jgi:hypothetical protein